MKKRDGYVKRESSRQFWKPSPVRAALLSALTCVWPSDGCVVDYTARGCAVNDNKAAMTKVMSASERADSARERTWRASEKRVGV